MKHIPAPILRAIEESYGSVVNPRWDFVLRRVREDPYAGLLRDLQNLAHVKDFTDFNYEVCQSCLLSCGSERINLNLSLVGRFAAVLVLDSGGKGRLRAVSVDSVQGLLGAVLTALAKHDVVPLSASELELVSPLRCTKRGEGKRLVFHDLFAEGKLPWSV